MEHTRRESTKTDATTSAQRTNPQCVPCASEAHVVNRPLRETQCNKRRAGQPMWFGSAARAHIHVVHEVAAKGGPSDHLGGRGKYCTRFNTHISVQTCFRAKTQGQGGFPEQTNKWMKCGECNCSCPSMMMTSGMSQKPRPVSHGNMVRPTATNASRRRCMHLRRDPVWQSSPGPRSRSASGSELLKLLLNLLLVNLARCAQMWGRHGGGPSRPRIAQQTTVTDHLPVTTTHTYEN